MLQPSIGTNLFKYQSDDAADCIEPKRAFFSFVLAKNLKKFLEILRVYEFPIAGSTTGKATLQSKFVFLSVHPNGFYWGHQCSWSLTSANSMQVSIIHSYNQNRK